MAAANDRTDQNKIDDLINQIARKRGVPLNARQSLRMANLLAHPGHGVVSRKSMIWWHPDKLRQLNITVPPGIELHHAMTYMQQVYAGNARLRGDGRARLARHQARVNAAEAAAEVARKLEVKRLAKEAKQKALDEQFKKVVAAAIENAIAPLKKLHQNLKNNHEKLLVKLANEESRKQQQSKAKQPNLSGQAGSSRNHARQNPIIDLTVNSNTNGNAATKRLPGSKGKRPRSRPPAANTRRHLRNRTHASYKNNSSSSSS